MNYRYFLLILLSVWMLTVSAGSVYAKPDDALTAAKADMVGVMANLEVDIRKAKDKLQIAADMDVNGQNQAVNEIFQGFKARTIEALQEVDVNSELVDALQGSKEKTIRLQKWFGRQTPDYPNRDEYVGRLQTALDSYEKSEDELIQQRSEALVTLSELGAANARAMKVINVRDMMANKVGQIEVSVQEIQNVVSSLQTLNSGLRQIVPDLDDSEINRILELLTNNDVMASGSHQSTEQCPRKIRIYSSEIDSLQNAEKESRNEIKQLNEQLSILTSGMYARFAGQNGMCLDTTADKLLPIKTTAEQLDTSARLRKADYLLLCIGNSMTEIDNMISAAKASNKSIKVIRLNGTRNKLANLRSIALTLSQQFAVHENKRMRLANAADEIARGCEESRIFFSQ